MQSRRPETLTTHLIRAGFADLTRSAALWWDPDLVAVLDHWPQGSPPAGRGADRGTAPGRDVVALEPAAAALLRSFACVADPDLPLQQLGRAVPAAPRPLTLREVGMRHTVQPMQHGLSLIYTSEPTIPTSQ